MSDQENLPENTPENNEVNSLLNVDGDAKVEINDGPNFKEEAGPVITEEPKLKNQLDYFALPQADAATAQENISKKYSDEENDNPANIEGLKARINHQISVSVAETGYYVGNTPWKEGSAFITGYQTGHANDITARFTNQIKKPSDNTVLGMRYAKFSGVGKRTLNGNAAVLAITAGMGLGSPVQVPMVDSGMRWVISTPTLEDFTALEERLGIEKGELGRQTLGYIFSYSDLYMIEIIFDFFTNYLTDCNVNGWSVDGVINKDLLFQLTKLTDLHALACGFLAGRYPNGHNLKQPCTSEDENCNHIHEGRVQFVNMLFIDEQQLTPDQLSFMTHAISHKHSVEEVVAYQNTIERPHKVFELERGDGAKLVFTFAVPSMDNFTSVGKQWINTTKRVINDNIRNLNDVQQTKKFLDKLILNNELKLFTCWISSLVFSTSDGVEITVDDVTTINRIVESLDSEPELLEKTLNALWEYISWASLSIVGVPQLRCRVCNKVQKDTSKAYPSLIPINVLNVFFTLLTPSQSPVDGIMSNIQRLAYS